MSGLEHPSPTTPPRPLIVRLRNWVGDVVLGVPTLRLLQNQGYALHLIGKRWAQELLKGECWTVEPLAHSTWARMAQLQALRQRCREQDPHFDQRLNALVLPYSFSSALEMRAAGLKAVGQAHEGRGFLLSRALPRKAGLHELEGYWQLVSPFLPAQAPKPSLPKAIALQVAPEHQKAAQALCLAHRISRGFIMLCPFAGGTFEKQPKTWPAFPELAQALRHSGRTLVLCPGPGEEAQAKEHYPGCLILSAVNLGVYAALLQQSALMISNDTGPGHLAAAVGTPTLSVLGPTLAAQWRPWGEHVACVQGTQQQWPLLSEVLQQTQMRLDPHQQGGHD